MTRIAAVLLALAALFLGGCGYNDMQRSDEQVKAAWSLLQDTGRLLNGLIRSLGDNNQQLTIKEQTEEYQIPDL